MRKVVFTLVGLGFFGLAAAALVVGSGLIPTSARPQHAELTRVLLHQTFKASVARAAEQAPEAPTDLSDPGRVALGAQHYAQVCASCHGAPGLGQSPQALSMRPSPQHLPAVVDQFTDRELYVILRDGVRFSAMPAWPAGSNFGEIWSLVAFLRAMEDMDAPAFHALTQPPAASPATVPSTAWREAGQTRPTQVVDLPQPALEYNGKVPGAGWRPIGLDGVPLARCASCHGLDGSGSPTGGYAPNIAIQDADFLAQRLRDYADGTRPSGIMTVVASALSGPQIEALAAYYAGQSGDMPAPEVSDADMANGQAVARVGLIDRAVPACAACHSAEGVAAGVPVPALAGQNAAFLRARLDSFATSPAVAPTGWNPMHDYAARLTEAERRDVAAYLASLLAGDPLMPAPIGSTNPGDITQSAALQSCLSCHGTDMAGGDQGIAPNLTLNTAAYHLEQLALFAQDERPSTLMQGAAHGLSEVEMGDVAAYLGGLAPLTATWTPEADADLVAAGRLLAEQGRPEDGITACLACHAPSAMEGLPMIPRLHGQSAPYLTSRLEAFAHPMAADGQDEGALSYLFARLTDADRSALAAYFASEAPLAK